MDDKRTRLLDWGTDDADVRGEHRYPEKEELDPLRKRRVRPKADAMHEADEALTRDPDQYVAGAEGTQRITTPASAEAPAGRPAREQ